MANMFTCAAVDLAAALAGAANNALVVSIMNPPPATVAQAVAAHGAQQIIVAIEDDDQIAQNLHEAVLEHGDTIKAHLAQGGIIILHCRAGRNRSTLMQFLLMWSFSPLATSAQLTAIVEAGRLGQNVGVPWNPKELVKKCINDLAWGRFKREMAWPFGADARTRSRFFRCKERDEAKAAAMSSE